MKRQLHFSAGFRSESIRGLLACVVALVFATNAAARDAKAAPATHAGATPVPEIKFVKSEFIAPPTLGSGKDPFFPKSKRTQTKTTETPIDTPSSFGWLRLNGISGTKLHRLAIINNKTFEQGEEAEMRNPNGQSAKVKIGEIADDGVVVSIGTQTQKLFLGTKL